MSEWFSRENGWVLLAAFLSLSDLKDAYRMYRQREYPLPKNFLFSIVSRILPTAALLITLIFNGTILTFSLIYYLNEAVRYAVLKYVHHRKTL